MLAGPFPSQDRNTEILHIMAADLRSSLFGPSHPQGMFCVVLRIVSIRMINVMKIHKSDLTTRMNQHLGLLFSSPPISDVQNFSKALSGSAQIPVASLQLLMRIPHPGSHTVHL